MTDKLEPRGFVPWEHEEDGFDRQVTEDVRPRDWLDDADDDDLQNWMESR